MATDVLWHGCCSYAITSCPSLALDLRILTVYYVSSIVGAPMKFSGLIFIIAERLCARHLIFAERVRHAMYVHVCLSVMQSLAYMHLHM